MPSAEGTMLRLLKRTISDTSPQCPHPRRSGCYVARVEFAFADYGCWSGEIEGVVPAQDQVSGQCFDSHRAFGNAPQYCRRSGAGGTGSRAFGWSHTALEETNIQGVPINHAHEGDVGPLGKVRMAFYFGADSLPVLGELGDKYGALGVADVEQGNLAQQVMQRKFLADVPGRVTRKAHIHFEHPNAVYHRDQTQMLGARAGVDGNVRGGLVFQEECSGTTGPVAGNLGFASVGVEEPDGVAPEQHPTVCADALMPGADLAGEGRQVCAFRHFVLPGQEEVVACAVGFGEGDFH